MKWQVHLDRDEREQYKTEPRYSISTDPEYGGWRTDSGYEGYGLPKELAQWMCDVLNKHGADCPYEFSQGWWSKK